MSGIPKSTLKILIQGQEQDVVPRLVQPNAALVIENMFFDHQGNLVKRYGSAALSTGTVPAGGSLGRAWALGKHKGSMVRLGRQGQAPLVTRSTTTAPWSVPVANPYTGPQRGPMVATVQKIGAVATAGNNYDHHDMDVGAGFQCVTYQEQSATPQQIHELLIDLATGHVVMDRTFGPTGHQVFPHVKVVASRYACFAYNSNGTVWVDIFDLQAADPTTATVWSAASEIVADTPLDIVPHSNGTDLIVGYRGQAGQFRAAIMRPSTAATVSIVNLKTQAGAAIAANQAFCWALNFDGATWSNGYPALATCDTGTGVVEHLGWTVSGGDFNAGRTTTVEGGANAVSLMTAATASGGSGTSIALDILYYTSSVKHAAVSTSGSSTITFDALQSFLASKMFRDAGGRSCFLVGTPWTNQATYYVLPVRASGENFPAPQCRTEVQAAYPAPPGQLPSVAVADASTVYLTAGVQVPHGVDGFGFPVTGANVDVVKIQFRNGVEPALPAPVLGNPVEAVDSLFVPGGQLMQWDGKGYGAAGLAYAPQTPTFTTTTGGSLTTGYTYSWCAVYARTDAQGRKWRSAPSLIVQSAPSAGTAYNLSTNYLQLVSQPGVEVEFYRDTQALPGVMHRLPGTIPNISGSVGSLNATMTDTYSDAAVLKGEVLYTTDGILPAAITPGALCLGVFDGRLWFVSADDPQSLWFSDPLTPPGTGGFLAGAGLFFTTDNIVDVRDDRGPITGLGTCDGRMVVFKHDACYVLEGNGPDNTGVGSTYQVQRIAGSVGLDNPRSVIDAFDGVWFQSSSSRAPIWRLDRGTGLQYVGQGVRDLGSLPIAGAVSLPEQSQIRWYTLDPAGGHVLVYDVIAQAWTTYTNPFISTSSACVVDWNGVATWSSEGPNTLGSILVETPGLYADAGNNFGQRAVLPWLQMADINGYQRIYSYQGIGQTIDDHLLKAVLYRNLSDTDNAFASQDFGMLLSGNPGWEWEIRFPMKVSSVKVELIGEAAKVDGTTPTAGFALSGIGIEYGIKVGLRPTVYTHRLTHA